MPRKKSNKLNFSFVALPRNITASPAFLVSKPAAKVIWFQLMERHNGQNNGEISLSVREAAKYVNCSPNSAGKHIDQLIAVGLIRRTMKTGFTMGKRLASTYALTHLPQGSKVATNDWKHYKSKSQ